ncbi:MAG TPA: 2OG-Fe(II) oxygenase [Chryseolinea sp.]
MHPHFEQIADGLAEAGFAVVDNFLANAEVDAILDLDIFREGVVNFRKAGIGKESQLQINETIRGDYIRWIDKNEAPPPAKVYMDRLQGLCEYLNQSLFLSLKDYEIHFTIYPAGSYYKRHLDQFKKDDHRKLSVICYLNKEWEEQHGGQLRMHTPDKPIDVLPLSGRLVCFRSDQIEHEVLPATKERLSLTGWMLDQLVDVRI